jgi:hypothetical protein
MRVSLPAILAALLVTVAAPVLPDSPTARTGLPRYEPDPYWPKPLPNHWMLGEVSGVAVDSHDHIWIILARGLSRTMTNTVRTERPIVVRRHHP